MIIKDNAHPDGRLILPDRRKYTSEECTTRPMTKEEIERYGKPSNIPPNASPSKVRKGDTERLVFEYAVLMCLQELHYEFGFGNKRLQKLIIGFSEKAMAFDSGAYDMEDLRNALKEDTGIELKITWCKDEKA